MFRFCKHVELWIWCLTKALINGNESNCAKWNNTSVLFFELYHTVLLPLAWLVWDSMWPKALPDVWHMKSHLIYFIWLLFIPSLLSYPLQLSSPRGVPPLVSQYEKWEVIFLKSTINYFLLQVQTSCQFNSDTFKSDLIAHSSATHPGDNKQARWGSCDQQGLPR